MSILDRRALPQDVATLQKRAELYGRLTVTTPVLEAIGSAPACRPTSRRGRPHDRRRADPPHRAGQRGASEPDPRVARAHRLELQSDPDEPVLTIYAVRLVAGSAAPRGLRRPGPAGLLLLARLQGFPEESSRSCASSAARAAAPPTARRDRDRRPDLRHRLRAELRPPPLAPSPFRRPGTEDAPVRPGARLSARAAADWPGTTACCPGRSPASSRCLADPVRQDRAGDPAPIDLTLDRLVLPVVVGDLADRLHRRPALAPRLRLTRVHLASARSSPARSSAWCSPPATSTRPASSCWP